MTKKLKNILLGMLIVAGLLIAVMYSPIGSPNLYTSPNYYAVNQSVNFENNEIPNATKVRAAPDNTDNDMPDMPDVSSSGHGATGSPVGSSSSATASSQSSSYAVQSTYLSNNPSAPAGDGGGAVMIAGRGSRGSAGTSGVTMTNGITSMSLSTNLTNNSITKQNTSQDYAANTRGNAFQNDTPNTRGNTFQDDTPNAGGTPQDNTANNGGTDPGGTDPGGDPTGPPIPVGDGWGVFVFFGVCYVAYKKRGFILSRLNFAAQRK